MLSVVERETERERERERERLLRWVTALEAGSVIIVQATQSVQNGSWVMTQLG